MAGEEGYSDFFGSNNAAKASDFEDEVDEPTKTPLWKYVTVVGSYTKGFRGTKTWLCNFNCREAPFARSYAHVRAHLLGQQFGHKSKGISTCSRLSKEMQMTLKHEEDKA
ncbi:hypothetical protein AMTR_s00016p00260420 [Amborella trichopoda]|uniref:Uncharacterized protein n=1 Tax=Amborella trichopoda TaxID=13333 RepID=W1PES2_AMBTC|nr:hypothetical protein AMTR_s00016p00260420 [Amborella trichopoda]